MEYQRVQLKMAAKQAIRQSRSGPRLTTFLYMAVMWAASMVLGTVALYASGMGAMSDMLGNAASWIDDPEFLLDYILWAAGARFLVTYAIYALISGVLSFLLNSLLNAGYNSYCLSLVRRQEPPMSAIFSGFSKAGSVIVTKLLVGVFIFLWSLLFIAALFIVLLVFGLIAAVAQSEVLEVVMALMAFAGYIGILVGIVWVTLRYSMVDFLIMDQGMSGMDCIRESKRLMQGNVGKLFGLHLSFIGWYLLPVGLLYALMLVPLLIGAAVGGASVGAGDMAVVGAVIGALVGFLVFMVGAVLLVIWLKPYVTGSLALFYDWARGAVPPAAGPRSWDSGAQNFHYTWSDGPGGSGTGIGSGPRPGGPDAGEGWGSGGWGGSQGGSAPGAGQSGSWGGSQGGSTPGAGQSGGWGGGPAPSGPEQDGGKPDIPAPKQPPRDDPWA